VLTSQQHTYHTGICVLFVGSLTYTVDTPCMWLQAVAAKEQFFFQTRAGATCSRVLLQCYCCPLWLSCNRSPVSAHLSALFEQMQASKACRRWQGSEAKAMSPIALWQQGDGGGGRNRRPQCRCTHTQRSISVHDFHPAQRNTTRNQGEREIENLVWLLKDTNSDFFSCQQCTHTYLLGFSTSICIYPCCSSCASRCK
jgi:hypothetical protein